MLFKIVTAIKENPDEISQLKQDGERILSLPPTERKEITLYLKSLELKNKEPEVD